MNGASSGSGFVSAQHQGTGSYVLTFDHAVNQCPSWPVFSHTPHFGTVESPDPPDTSSIHVSVFDVAGNPADDFFSLHIAC